MNDKRMDFDEGVRAMNKIKLVQIGKTTSPKSNKPYELNLSPILEQKLSQMKVPPKTYENLKQ